MAKKESNIPITGMSPAHPMNVKENEYPFMLNGGLQTDISGPVTLTNEPSNILCTNFPAGYVVIGTLFVPEDNITYVWLVNPSVEVSPGVFASQIGWISEYNLTDANDQYVDNPCSDCIKKKEEATPLEDTVQQPTCVYTCISTADCLNFNLDFPVRKAVLKKKDCGDILYFTDFFNPIRLLRLTPGHQIDDSQRGIISKVDCEQPEYQPYCSANDIDCRQLMLFPQAEQVGVKAISVNSGGTLKAGSYQIAVCYATKTGEKATRTFATSNPVSIFDPNHTVVSDGVLDYVTDLSITFSIENLDPSQYNYIDVFAIGYTNRVPSFRKINPIDITPSNNGTFIFKLSNFEAGKEATIDDILEQFDVYELAQEIATASDMLFFGNLTGPRDLNLQQAVIGISPFVKWQTVEANEALYADGVAAANARTYLRDELYALGIVFERSNTQDTCAYPLVGRCKNTVVMTGSAYSYKGNWSPTATYNNFSIVSYGNDAYVGNSPTVGIAPPSGWTLITAVNAASFGILPDTQVISNPDAFTFPGCNSPVTNLRWQVYNTAYNRGLAADTSGTPCGYNASQVQCVQKVDQVICTSFSYNPTSIAISGTTGVFANNETITWDNGSPQSAIVSFANQLLGYLLLVTDSVSVPFLGGEVITGSITGASATVTSYFKGNTPPADCYQDLSNVSGSCIANYPTAYNNPYLEPPSGSCTPNVYPSGDCDPSGGCHSGFVRGLTAWQASTSYPAGITVSYNNDTYLSLAPTHGNTPTLSPGSWSLIPSLCVDNQLLAYPSDISIPYAILCTSKETQISQLKTADYYIYTLPSAQAKTIPNPPDPTQSLTNGPYEDCIPGSQYFRNTNGTWLWYDVNMPSGQPPNNLGPNAIGVTVSPSNDCIGFTAPQSMPNYPMYFLGNNITAGPNYLDCSGTTVAGDYWNLGGLVIAPGTSEVNDTLYQSYWYSFTATSNIPTVIIKAKILDAYNGNAGLPIFQAGDFRIDVYESTPVGTPLYSTGHDATSPALVYYTGAQADTGVLIAADVGGSVPLANLGGVNAGQQQLPLIAGTVYYIHIYLLAPGRAKLNQAATKNDQKHTSGGICDCYNVNYAWANLCINYPKTGQTKQVTTPALNALNCTYNIYYRVKEVVDPGCGFQPFEYGDFAYWEADTMVYPDSMYTDPNGVQQPLWGELCGQPIRHFKFPDCLVSYLQDENPVDASNPGRQAKIYPIGITIDTEVVKTWLNWAFNQGLITLNELNSITGYKIVRGNRVGNKSVVAKGLLYDMWRYNEFDPYNSIYSATPTYYPNYPFNDLRSDPYLNNNGQAFIAPNAGTGNNRYAFLSPDTTFNAPVLGPELKLEAVNYGDSLGKFYQVINHPKYILISQAGIDLAIALAAIQLTADLLILLGQLYGTEIVGLADSIPVGFIIGLVGGIANLVPKFFTYAQEWETIITNFGVPQNFVKYYAAVGNYHSSGLTGYVANDIGEKRRLINLGYYLLAGNISLSNNGILEKINNYEREDSVYVNLSQSISYLNQVDNFGNPSLAIITHPDQSRFLMSDAQGVGAGCSQGDRQAPISSYYGSIKNFVPDQYGMIQDIQWIYTGEFRELDFTTIQETGCDVILGGDTFICRMTQKRKMPFFLYNPVGVVTGVDFQYQPIPNITNATYYFNSVGNSVLNSSSVQFKTVEHNFDCDTTGNGMFLQGTMYLASYGIVSFICESDFNLNFRYATDTKINTFYPYQSDIQNWTQEFEVPIVTPNTYFYNRDYSRQNLENFFCSQPAIYHDGQCNYNYRNRVIYSVPDEDSSFYLDNWRIFLAANYHDFPLVNGQLKGLDGIEKEAVMARFTATTWVFNAFYTITTSSGDAQIGTGNMFDQKPDEYVKSDLGYGGSEHHAFTSTPSGHFWVDAERHNILTIPPHLSRYRSSGEGLKDIAESYAPYFRNNLPFFLSQDFPDYDTDNNYKGVGLTMCWDNKFDRLFLTKLDYQLLPEWKGVVHYDTVLDEFYTQQGRLRHVISLSDTTYFCNKSWTAAWAAATQTWIGFYSFTPNYYVSHKTYFQSGVNFVNPGAFQTGLWNHLITNKSYQVFYGTLCPFITDVIVREAQYNKQLHSLEYQADFLRFQNDYDYYYNPGVTFNKMVIWSENQNSGNLVLVPQKPLDQSQTLLYPATGTNSTTILVTRKTHNWRINQFYDLVANKHNNVPPMIYNCSPYLKEVNPDAINYVKPTFQRQHFTSDYFTLRFINDKYSNYKIINKWFLNSTIQSIS